MLYGEYEKMTLILDEAVKELREIIDFFKVKG
jgi:hypothetical protein